MNLSLSLLLIASLLALSYEGKLWSDTVREVSRDRVEEVRMQMKCDSMAIVAVNQKRVKKEER